MWEMLEALDTEVVLGLGEGGVDGVWCGYDLTHLSN